MSEPGFGPDADFRRAAAIVAIVAFVLAVGCSITGLMAVRFDTGVMSNPDLLLGAGHAAAGLWRASLLLDLFGYYLMLVPLILVLRAESRPRAGSWSDLFAFCLLAYSLVGAMGAAMLAMSTPPMMDAYTAAGVADRQLLQTAFSAQFNDVYRGLWNTLEAFLGGVGWLGFGWLMLARNRWIAILTLALGLAELADSAGMISSQDWLFSAGLNVYLALATIWPLVMGIRLLGRRPLVADG